MELTALSITEAARLIEQRQLSPVELTRAHLERIEQIDPAINSFITVAAEAALQQAQAAEVEIGRGQYRGPLHGIPIGLKDIFETQGLRTTAGSKFLADSIPSEDAAVVKRLKQQGAIILGKQNMHEWAMSVTTNNPHYGACKNPWMPDCIPGGSSGGSGAALAAQLCMGSLGSDTAGSIRIPAAFCGVVGLKPTYGRVSRRGVIPLSWSLDHVGPLARRVADVALLLGAITGYDPSDPYSIDAPEDDYLAQLEGGVKGWHIALARDGFLSEAKHDDPEVAQAVEQAVSIFEQLGARVSEIALPEAREAQQMALRIIVSDAALFHRERMEERPEDFGVDVLSALRRGASHTAVDYAQARRTQMMLRHHWGALFNTYDLIMTPTTPTTAPPREETPDSKAHRPSLVSYTAPFSLMGMPALSVPCGLSQAGLPIGLQLVAPVWTEARLLRAGYAYEQAAGWYIPTIRPM
ncbi:MAG: amidase [Herpetosiphonaceae bacterium]|nr:MAG: amidase [Herpetosiphonaceae bacterium]